MKRDFDLIRSIMFDVENTPAGECLPRKVYDGFDQMTVNLHIVLLIEAGYLDGTVTSSYHNLMVRRLTWKGHDMLDAMRDEGIWNKAKEKFFIPAGNIALDILIDWLKMEARTRLGLPV
jgi:hypothetical protein